MPQPPLSAAIPRPVPATNAAARGNATSAAVVRRRPAVLASPRRAKRDTKLMAGETR